MPEPKAVNKRQLVNCLRQRGYTFKRQGKRREVWKKKGGTTRVFVPMKASIDSREAVVVLKQAGLSSEQVDEFLRGVDLV